MAARLRRGVPRLVGIIGLATVAASSGRAGVAVLLVDTDRVEGRIDERIYGQFLEHINHSVVDGLFAEQIRGQGFEGTDFKDDWATQSDRGAAELVKTTFRGGERSVRLSAENGVARLSQGRVRLEAGHSYDGSLWVRPAGGTLSLRLKVTYADGRVASDLPLPAKGRDWQEIHFSFPSARDDADVTIEIAGTGTGAALVDFVSLMRSDVRAHGKLRPDLLEALRELKPAFIRWPGGSYASVYEWKDGIGPAVARRFHPNTIWGGYSDYYGFGTDEFMELCRQLDAQPLVVLRATNTDPAQLENALDWVHYLLDPPTTDWGRRRAANGHPAPYVVPYFQIDNEPMNHALTAEAYAAIVNLYGSRLRRIAPHVKIVACGQKRSNDMQWSEKLIDLAGDNFDVLGCHNYEYEPDNYATGVRRIEDYLEKVCAYARRSRHPAIQVAVLEWGLCRTYDWRAGLHAAGMLIAYEKLSPELTLSCPALLMRNTTDNPEWRAWIYHDHVSWFAGGGYVAEKLFRDHFAPLRYATTSGTVRDLPNRAAFFDEIDQMKPEQWTPGTVDAIAAGSTDQHRTVIKAVNYGGETQTLLVRLQGSHAPARAVVTVSSVTASPGDENSLAQPHRIHPEDRTIPYARDLAVELAPYTVAAIDIDAATRGAAPGDR